MRCHSLSFAAAAISPGLPSLAPLTLGCPRLPVLGGFGAWMTALARSLDVTVTRSGSDAIDLQANAETPTLSIRRPGKRPATFAIRIAARSCWDGRRSGFG